MEKEKKKSKRNPMNQANLLSFITFSWMNDFFRKGYKENLQEHDMYPILKNDSSDVITSRLKRKWKQEIESARRNNKTPSLLLAVVKTYWFDWVTYGVFGLIEETLHIFTPLFIGGLLSYFEGKETLTGAYMYATGICLILIGLTLIHHIYFYYLQRLGWHIRAGMCALMYKKTLKLSQKSLAATTTGQIVNLGSTDVMRFDFVTLFLHYLILAPLQAIVVTYLLWRYLGASSLIGLAIIFLVSVGQSIMGRQFGRIRAKMALLTDERIRVMNEVITAMRIVKMYTWETSFQKFVDKIRRREVKKVLSSSILKACNFSMMFLSTKLVALASFTSYVVAGGHLTASNVFPALSLYNVVRVSMGIFFPLAIEKYSESIVSLKRIQDFLLLDEQDIEKEKLPAHSDTECSVVIRDFTASWSDENEPTLSDVNVEVKSGQLLAVIGPVGSGKSSLLSAILHELKPKLGDMEVKGQVVYAGQVPWVFSGTVRENILFGEEYDSLRYGAVIKACALTKDLEALAFSDQTLVGERGVTLSGGQKARINLARAAYREKSDIILLDDPLSAVDAAVAAQLFHDCICGYMREKVRVLVTHQLQFLKGADQVLILKEGAVAGLGTYEELQAKGTDFAALLHKDEEEEKKNDLMLSAALSDDNLNQHHVISEDKIRVGQSLLSLQNLHLMTGSMTDIRVSPDDSDQLIRSFSMSDARPNIKHKNVTNNVQTSKQEESEKMLLNNEQAEFVAPVREEETKVQGSVGWKVYKEYFGTNSCLLFVLILLLLSNHVTFVLCDWWLSIWATKSEVFYSRLELMDYNISMEANASVPYNMTLVGTDGYNSSANEGFTETTDLQFDDTYYIVIFAILTGVFAVLIYARSILQFYYCVISGIHMHDKMFHALLHSHTRFIDTNPVGRILNRFSKDMGQIDEILPATFMDFIYIFFTIITVLILAIIINYFVGIIAIPLVAYFIWLRQYYLKTSRDIKRMEGASRSPVFTHLSSTLQGLTTVRAFKMQEKFEEEFHIRQDAHSAAWFLFLTGSRWLAMRLDAICAIFIGTVAFFSIVFVSMTDVDAGQVGLTLTYSMMLMGMFQWGTRQSAEVENLMTSVERIQEYYKIPPEAAHERPENKPPPGWPQYGIITFDNLSYAHYVDGPDILHRVRLNVKAHEKVGIVGRTGAGKSSLISTLFRLNEYSQGEIYIDGVATSQLGLTDLRSVISIIPQDPILFAGTMRKNLDIFGDYTDAELWKALEQVQLRPLVENLPMKLESALSEAGSNFSVGQRQLVCLARAILRKNKILIIDEATANVDIRTDHLVQEAIRSNFKHCTALTIAHRLHTIIDCDRVMVLDAGEVVEFEEPHLLLNNKDSVFASMVDSTGKAEATSLKDAAKRAYEIRHEVTSDVEDGDRSYMARFLPTPGTYDHLELETNI
ncbi:unnamed protein product [Clavelina lepadiformis]|uniref:Cystic fibrosis transmembrane conductance regulator n=1 Tax=Clavelina lepadiformis TaxID=159417 RepID=A0ABP0FIL3_CLALP